MNPDPPVTSTRILEKLIASLAYNTLILNDLAVNVAAAAARSGVCYPKSLARPTLLGAKATAE